MCLQIKFYIFFGFFLLFIKYLTKSLYSDHSIFVPILIISKKIQKNIKFDLQAHLRLVFFSLYYFFCDTGYTLCLQSPNSRSKPFNLLDMLKCACRSNFTFFWIFLLFIKMGTKIQWSKYSDFVKYLINRKKFKKM